MPLSVDNPFFDLLTSGSVHVLGLPWIVSLPVLVLIAQAISEFIQMAADWLMVVMTMFQVNRFSGCPPESLSTYLRPVWPFHFLCCEWYQCFVTVCPYSSQVSCFSRICNTFCLSAFMSLFSSHLLCKHFTLTFKSWLTKCDLMVDWNNMFCQTLTVSLTITVYFGIVVFVYNLVEFRLVHLFVCKC